MTTPVGKMMMCFEIMSELPDGNYCAKFVQGESLSLLENGANREKAFIEAMEESNRLFPEVWVKLYEIARGHGSWRQIKDVFRGIQGWKTRLTQEAVELRQECLRLYQLRDHMAQDMDKARNCLARGDVSGAQRLLNAWNECTCGEGSTCAGNHSDQSGEESESSNP